MVSEPMNIGFKNRCSKSVKVDGVSGNGCKKNDLIPPLTPNDAPEIQIEPDLQAIIDRWNNLQSISSRQSKPPLNHRGENNFSVSLHRQ